jgi:hypothetical protein
MNPLRRAAEAALPRILPNHVSSTLLAIGDRYSQYRRYRRSDSPAATKIIESNLGLTVRRGPFAGMIYPNANAYSRHSIPKLMGCYEEELHCAIQACVGDSSYRRYVDIGSAEGYYSVGLAFAAQRPVYAFEIEPFERSYTRLMAKANGVEGLVNLGGWCSSERLLALCRDRSFILCDCEGYEAELFTPAAAAALRESDLIIELHDAPDVEVKALIVERFRATHHVELITSRPRSAADFPELKELNLNQDRFVSEFRQPGQQWAVISARR